MIQISKKVYLVPGANHSLFPYCACLYLKGKDLRLLIDAGMGSANLAPCIKEGFDLVILSHCHLDHRLTLSQFPSVPVWCHEIETVFLENRERFLTSVGLLRGGIDMEKLYPGITIQEFSIQKKLHDGESINLGGLSLEVFHTPGHTPGHLSFFIPEAKLVFAADITLTAFGPFYGHDFSSINHTIDSIRKLKALPAQTVITSHSGPFQENLAERFTAYEKVIDQRDRRLLRHLNQPKAFSDLLGKNLIYAKYREPKPLTQWFEQVHLEKHWRRLIEMDLIKEKDGLYCT
jgi:glyoxylase-like metal-dependent hydrolase (beta-lactamase superfamily II)